MRLFAIAGTDAPRTTTVELPVADSPSGMVWATRRALVVRDIDTETGFPAAMDLHREMGTRSMCIVPLTSPLRQLGEPMYLLDSNPTVERIAKLIFDRAKEEGLPVVRVTVWETPTSFAEYVTHE